MPAERWMRLGITSSTKTVRGLSRLAFDAVLRLPQQWSKRVSESPLVGAYNVSSTDSSS